MRKITTLLFALMLLVAACGDDDAAVAEAGSSTETTIAAADEEAHEEGDSHDQEAHEEGDSHDEEAHEEDEVHEEDDGHDEEAHEDDGAVDVAAMFVSEENIPEAEGEVTAEVTVTMTEFGFDPPVIDLTPGETVRFTLINEGQLGHEFRLTTVHKAEEHVASGHEDHGDESHHEDADIIVNVEPGTTRTVEMTLPEDVTTVDHTACLIPGHYEAGMFGTVEY